MTGSEVWGNQPPWSGSSKPFLRVAHGRKFQRSYHSAMKEQQVAALSYRDEKFLRSPLRSMTEQQVVAKQAHARPNAPA